MNKNKKIMKVQIRQTVFETNSSSTHSMSIASKEQFDKFEAGELYYADGELITREELIEQINEHNVEYGEKYGLIDVADDDAINDYITDNGIQTWESFGDDYELFTQSFTTASGDEIVAFGYYGYNG